jgi:molybdopterin synthase catalytic subunit
VSSFANHLHGHAGTAWAATLQELCQQLRSKWDVTHVVMAHRTGVVEVCEASVIIAVSSPHRKAALEVSSWLIG